MAPRRTKTAQHQDAARDLILERGLPCDLEAERFVLAAVLNDDSNLEKLAAILSAEDFTTEAHRRIWGRMQDLAARGERVDRVTLSGELLDVGQLESVGGLEVLVSLDQGMPEIAHPESYARRVREKAQLRDIIRRSQQHIDLAVTSAATAQDIATRAIQDMAPIQDGAAETEDGRRPEEIVTRFPGGISAFLDPSLRKQGLPTGLRRLDEMLGGGLRDGELVIIAARPAMGKSSLALNICQFVSVKDKNRNPQRSDIFSLEMSAESLVARMLCAVARVDAHKFRSGYTNPDDRRRLQVALDLIVQSQLRIHDDFTKTLPALIRRIRQAKKQGSRLIVIDYIQLMITGDRSENRNLEVGEMSRALKLEALRLEMPILLLSQLSRQTERRGGDMKPQLSDLRDSGSLEQDADTVAFIYREEVYKKDREDIKGLADLIIAKQRNGPTGNVPLRFLGAYTKFESRAEDMAFPEEEESSATETATEPVGEPEGWD